MGNNVIARKAVLIYPAFGGDTFWDLKGSLLRYIPLNKFGLPKRTLPPLGLMGLYNHLKDYYEDRVLIDRNIDPRPLEERIAGDCHVYIGGMFAQNKGLLKDANVVMNAKKPLIIGGPIVDENFSLKGRRDVTLVENEAEMVIDAVLDDVRHGRSGNYYQGTHTPPDKFFRPDFSSISLNDYVNLAIQTSRGCPEDCEFCDITNRFGRNVRTSPWEHIEASIQQMHELGSRKAIFVVDDNFIGNPKQAIEVLKKIYNLEQKLGYNFPKYTELTLRLSDESPIMEELRYWLHKTNFTMQFIGVETNNVASLVETGKSQNIGKKSITEKLLYISEKTGSRVTAGIIHGFDNDTTSSVDSLVEFINSTHVPIVMVSLLNALHNTKLWNRLENEVRLMKGTSGNNSDGSINFIPNNFSAKQAELNYIKILKGIYNEKEFFRRVMRELAIFDPQAPENVVPPEDMAYSLIRILTKKNAMTFWKYLPKAHEIAKKRFGFNTPEYKYVVGTYLANCAQFTHFKEQTMYLENQVKHREYKPWQLYSWKEIQESPVSSVVVIKPYENRPSPSLLEKVRIRLDNGYEIMGSRLEALTQFVTPRLEKGLQKLQTFKSPSLKQFLDVEVKAYLETHFKKPEILGNLSFADVETHLRETIQNQIIYLNQRYRLFKRMVGDTTPNVHL